MRLRLLLALLAVVVVVTACREADVAAPQATSTAVGSPTAPSPTTAPPATTPPATTPPATGPTPPPAPSPSGTAVEEAAALAAAEQRRAEREDCDEAAQDEHDVVTEVDGALLVHVVCFVGAYQTNGELRLFDGEELRPLTVEQWQFGEVVDTPEVVGLVAASSDGTTVFNDVKYRGLGDCGLTQTWSFDGTALLLEQARERECSDDEEFVPPDQWPLVYER